MSDRSDLYRGFHFPAEVISHAVWLYARFAPSYRTEAAECFFRNLLGHVGAPPERSMQGFKSMESAQQFLSLFSRVCNLFRPRRHLLAAAEYRMSMQARFRTWSEITGVVCA